MAKFSLQENYTSDSSKSDDSDEEFHTETDSEFSYSSPSSSDEEEEEEEQQQQQVLQPPKQKRAKSTGGRATESQPTRCNKDEWLEETFLPDVPPFTAKSGPTIIISEETTPLEVFQQLVLDDILEVVVNQTNLYANQVLDQGEHKTHSRAISWVPLSLQELKNFLGLTILMGLDDKPAIEAYWAKSDVFYNYIFQAECQGTVINVMIRRLLYFADNTHWNPNDENRDRLYKVRAFVESLL